MCIIKKCLVGGLEHVFHILGITIRTDYDYIIFFRGVESTDQVYMCMYVYIYIYTCV